MVQLNKEKESIYKQEADFRDSIFSKYHDTATLAGIYKYEQAKELIADNTSEAPDIRAEAASRGVAPEVVAGRIIQNHESFRQKEAKIAGIRGKVLDRIESFTFNMEDPDASYQEFKTEEKIGSVKRSEFKDGEVVDIDVDVNVYKYSLSLPARFKFE